jgi:hypothetical protein
MGSFRRNHTVPESPLLSSQPCSHNETFLLHFEFASSILIKPSVLAKDQVSLLSDWSIRFQIELYLFGQSDLCTDEWYDIRMMN